MDSAVDHDALAEPGLYLTFMLGAERFAIPAGFIREIIHFSVLTEVPLMPDFLRGVLNVRGTVVPVMDLSLRLGRPPVVQGRRTCVVILDLPQGARCLTIGLLVDMVHAVRRLRDALFEMPAETQGPIRPEFTIGELELDGVRVTGLNLETLLNPQELAELMGGAGFPRAAGPSLSDPRGAHEPAD